VWASTDQVASVTGRTVTAEQLAQADSVITIYCNRTPDASASIGVRDLYWLRMATCWQAAWQTQQSGYDSRNNAASIGQDGLSIQRVTEHSATLAPLAARALKNVSWIGSRTLRVPNVSVPPGTAVLDFTSEASDERSDWELL
jgi:hypothetical protein